MRLQDALIDSKEPGKYARRNDIDSGISSIMYKLDGKTNKNQIKVVSIYSMTTVGDKYTLGLIGNTPHFSLDDIMSESWSIIHESNIPGTRI